MKDLCEPFGEVIKLFVAEGRGFAFVTFRHREDAAKAIQKLNGYGYASLILTAEWPRPSV